MKSFCQFNRLKTQIKMDTININHGNKKCCNEFWSIFSVLTVVCLFSIFMCYVLIATWMMTMDVYNDQSELEDLIEKVIRRNSTTSI